MFFEYRCTLCGDIYESQQFEHAGQPSRSLLCCGASPIRIISAGIQTHRPFEPYYNHSVGEWVKDDAHYKRILKRKSIEHSERVGTQINLQPVYPADMKADDGKALGVTPDESIEHTRRHNPDGYKPSTSKIIA
jgi:hypothetical protein